MPTSRAQLALTDLFNEAGIGRLYTYAEDYNPPSRRSCERLGKRCEVLLMKFVKFANKPCSTPHYENAMQYTVLKKERWG